MIDRRSTATGPCQGAARDQTVQMQMLREILPPRVQNRDDADRAAEMARIAAEGEQRVGGRAEQQRVDHARIPLREGVERCGSVKTTWKYGMGKRSARRAASHRSFLSV